MDPDMVLNWMLAFVLVLAALLVVALLRLSTLLGLVEGRLEAARQATARAVEEAAWWRARAGGLPRSPTGDTTMRLPATRPAPPAQHGGPR